MVFFFFCFSDTRRTFTTAARGFRRADGRSSSSRTRCPDGNPIKRNNMSCRNAVCNLRHGFRRGVSKTTRKTAESGEVRIARSAREQLGTLNKNKFWDEKKNRNLWWVINRQVIKNLLYYVIDLLLISQGVTIFIDSKAMPKHWIRKWFWESLVKSVHLILKISV